MKKDKFISKIVDKKLNDHSYSLGNKFQVVIEEELSLVEQVHFQQNLI